MAKLPSAEQLKQIPLYAIVAYTVRCAMRVQSLYTISEEHPDSKSCTEAIQNAIRISVEFASGKEINPDEAADAEEAVIQAVVIASEGDAANKLSALSANAAYAAINAANTALASQNAASRATEANKTVLAAVTAADAASAAEGSIKNSVDRDWQRLHRLRLGGYPELGKPVNPISNRTLGPVFEDRQNKRSKQS